MNAVMMRGAGSVDRACVVRAMLPQRRGEAVEMHKRHARRATSTTLCRRRRFGLKARAPWLQCVLHAPVVTVAILAQGTLRADAVMQAFFIVPIGLRSWVPASLAATFRCEALGKSGSDLPGPRFRNRRQMRAGVRAYACAFCVSSVRSSHANCRHSVLLTYKLLESGP